jgi:hypothetical protein
MVKRKSMRKWRGGYRGLPRFAQGRSFIQDTISGFTLINMRDKNLVYKPEKGWIVSSPDDKEKIFPSYFKARKYVLLQRRKK